MSLPWIPLSVEFPDSRKAIALGIALQDPLAWAYVVRLWCWCARNAPEGKVEGPDAAAVLEHGAGWKGAPGAFVEAAALRHVALLDPTERGWAVHDWDEHCGAHVEKRRKDRDRMRDHRERVRERFGNGSGTVGEGNADVRRKRKRETETEGSAA